MWHPAILDGRTWSKLEEHVKDGKHQPDDLKHSFYYSKHHFFVKQMTQNTFTAFMATVAEIITYIGAWKTWSWVNSRCEKIQQNVHFPEPPLNKNVFYWIKRLLSFLAGKEVSRALFHIISSTCCHPYLSSTQYFISSCFSLSVKVKENHFWENVY